LALIKPSLGDATQAAAAGSVNMRLAAWPAAVAIALVSGASAAPAAAAPLEMGVQDDALFVREPSAHGWQLGKLISRDAAYGAARKLSVRVVRVNLIWTHVAPAKKGGAWDWSYYDAFVDDALARGIEPQFTLTGPAPAWATGNGKEGIVRPKPGLFAEFVSAAAARYAGRVRRYSIWNEPNWPSWLAPKSDEPAIYRGLYLAAYDAIKRVDPAADVLIGELAPMGPPTAGTAPLRFLRALTCSNTKWQRQGSCPALTADGFAHHPYTLRWAPEYKGRADDVTMGSLGRLERALRLLARRGALATPSRQPPPVYLTEFGYRANSRVVPEKDRATFTRRAYEIAARDGQVRELVWYQLAAPPPKSPSSWDTSLLALGGKPSKTYLALVQWVAGAVNAGRVAPAPGG
jgi:hypothetical protein